jgi:hypothetical protein
MSVVENQTKKRVMIIEIEFLEDIDRNIWVSFIRDLKVAEPALCIHYLIRTTNDLKTIPIKSPSTTKFSKLAKGQHVTEKKGHSKPPIDYTFCKGRIRNKKSDLNLDISIKPPENPRQEEPGSPLPSSQMLLKSLSIRKSGIIKASTPQSRSPPHIEAMRARALHDELMKSPELKTKFRLYGLVGVLGIELQRSHRRSLSDSEFRADYEKAVKTDNRFETIKKTGKITSSGSSPKTSRPRSRLVLRYSSPKTPRQSSPKFLHFS